MSHNLSASVPLETFMGRRTGLDSHPVGGLQTALALVDSEVDPRDSICRWFPFAAVPLFPCSDVLTFYTLYHVRSRVCWFVCRAEALLSTEMERPQKRDATTDSFKTVSNIVFCLSSHHSHLIINICEFHLLFSYTFYTGFSSLNTYVCKRIIHSRSTSGTMLCDHV